MQYPVYHIYGLYINTVNVYIIPLTYRIRYMQLRACKEFKRITFPVYVVAAL